MNDLITVFNRLTSSQLADCNLFETILGKHYDKFKYFYFIIIDLPIEDINRIMCIVKNSVISFVISLKNEKECKSYLNKLIKYFNNFDNPYYTDYFDYTAEKDDLRVIITIKCKTKYKNEEDVYADRFNLP